MTTAPALRSSSESLREDPLDPELPIIDSGHHLYDRPGRRYLIFEYLEDLASGHHVTDTVAIEDLSMFRAEGPEALRCIGETEFYNGAAAMSASGRYGPTRICAAIVGFADLRLGASVEQVLEAHVAAGGGRFRGVRMSAAVPLSTFHSATPDGAASAPAPADPVRAEGRIWPGMLREASIREGLSRLAAMGLSFDVHANHPQLDDLLALARSVPSATIILNHCGQPLGVGPFAMRRTEVFASWRASMLALASCPNVHVKLGGLRRSGALPFDADSSHATSDEIARALGSYIDVCVDAFGAGRCMFESNFPPDHAVAGYGVLWNAYKRITSGCSAHERAALFAETARRIYRIPEGAARPATQASLQPAVNSERTDTA